MSVAVAQPLLALRDLSLVVPLRSGPATAVNGVSLEIGRGESVAIVGESGSGKTMTALAMIGLLPPGVHRTQGTLEVDGEALPAGDTQATRGLRGRRVGMVFQDSMTSLNPVLTVGAQLTETLQHHLGLDGAQARERALELLGDVGIADPGRRLGQYPHQLSGGLRQRVAIAMALAPDPDLLIADEPTTALDVTVQAQILAMLARERERRGMSLVLITHDLGVVASICERVIVMYAGQVVEAGDIEGVFARPAHPYTRGLLGSAPRIDGALGERLPSIGGTPPALGAFPRGCPFEPRCSLGMPVCSADNPALLPIGIDERLVACWACLPERRP
jgi:oligopeptide/dipeptide ABC transporter ATP-binding protein